ncbi:hypothetical protein QL285_057667 [Trifolium repens]|nr:hypothetical protein QL285_057667 [Trifolium repens]
MANATTERVYWRWRQQIKPSDPTWSVSPSSSPSSISSPLTNAGEGRRNSRKEAIDDGDDEKWWLAVEWTASQIGLAYTSIVYFESAGFTRIDDLMELTFCIKEKEECQDLLKKPTILELKQKTKTLHEDRMNSSAFFALLVLCRWRLC